MVPVSVTQGSIISHTTFWISPDRDKATFTRVKRVRKFEDQLSSVVNLNVSLVDVVGVGKRFQSYLEISL